MRLPQEDKDLDKEPAFPLPAGPQVEKPFFEAELQPAMSSAGYQASGAHHRSHLTKL